MVILNPKLRILLIDDDLHFLEIIADYLRQTLHAMVVTSSSIQRAFIEIADQGPFDVLVSDYQIPPYTAADLVRHLKSVDDQTPLLLHSGFDAIDETPFKNSNYLGLIVKPDLRGVAAQLVARFPRAKKS